MIGVRYGKLTVIRKLDKTTVGRTKYLCRCDCGNEKCVLDYNLKNNHTTSCGCVRGKKRGEQLKIERGLASKHLLYTKYKYSALRRNIEFDLEFDYFIELTSNVCHYCGALPNRSIAHTRSNGDYIYNGIDRKDNTKGYIINNVYSCCFICNRAKGDLSYEEYKLWIVRTYNHMEKML